MALENYRNDMLRCSRCSCCKYIPLLSIIKSKRFSYNCPAVTRNNFHAYSGSGKLIMALSLIDERIEWSDKLMEILFNCTLCGACDVSCRSGTEMELWEILHEFRVRAFDEGKAPLPKHKPIMDSIVNYDNVWMQPRSARVRALRGIEGMKDLTREKAEVLYYVGCTYSLDPSLRDVVHNTAKILLKAGVDLGTLGKSEVCCASPAHTIGNEKLFNKYAKKNIETFNKLGVKKVVTSCAGCYSMFNAHYKRLGLEMNFEVQSAIEYIDELIQEGQLKPEKDVETKVTYHDPCHLGRLSEPRKPSLGKEERILGTLFVKDTDKVMGFKGVFDPPRNVLKSIPGIDFREMERIREYSWCCGSGGGVKSGFPEFALWAATERIEEALSTGAEALVTNCPWCERNFKDAASEHEQGIKVLNTTELLMKTFE